jgi:hypothetical protein
MGMGGNRASSRQMTDIHTGKAPWPNQRIASFLPNAVRSLRDRALARSLMLARRKTGISDSRTRQSAGNQRPRRYLPRSGERGYQNGGP